MDSPSENIHPAKPPKTGESGGINWIAPEDWNISEFSSAFSWSINSVKLSSNYSPRETRIQMMMVRKAGLSFSGVNTDKDHKNGAMKFAELSHRLHFFAGFQHRAQSPFSVVLRRRGPINSEWVNDFIFTCFLRSLFCSRNYANRGVMILDVYK